MLFKNRKRFLNETDHDVLIYIVSVKQKYDNICVLQINEFVKRARAAKIHAYIISHLKKEMPAMMGKAKAQQRLTDNLEDEFAKVYTCPISLFLSFDIYIYIYTRMYKRHQIIKDSWI